MSAYPYPTLVVAVCECVPGVMDVPRPITKVYPLTNVQLV